MKLVFPVTLGLLLFITTFLCQAAISVGSSGTGWIAFNAFPFVADGWSSGFLPGGAGAFTNSTQFDQAVQTLNATNIRTPLLITGTVPPSTFGTNRWNSQLLAIQSRPTGVAATLLLAILRNDSGAALNGFVLSYDFATYVTPDSAITEDIPGYRVFYSTTGAPDSWNFIPDFFVQQPDNTTNRLTAFLAPAGGWAPGSNLYILWADDNGPGSDTAPSREGGYTIDNFELGPIPTSNTTFRVTSPTNGQVFFAGSKVVFSAVLGSLNPVSVDFFANATFLGTASTPPFAITNSTLAPGYYKITAVAHDSQNSFTSTNDVTISIGIFGSIRVLQVEVCWNSMIGLSYDVEYKSDATAPVWLPLRSFIAATPPTNCIVDTLDPGQPRRLYRILQSH